MEVTPIGCGWDDEPAIVPNLTDKTTAPAVLILKGGHREPLLMRWPGRIKPGEASDALFGLTDIMATLAAIVGVDLSDQAAPDSFDMSPVLSGAQPNPPIRDHLIHHSGMGVFSLRSGRWKLILDTQGSGGWPLPAGKPPEPGTPGQLYDLADDPGEKQNLWDLFPDVVKRLRDELEQYRLAGRTTPHRL